MPITSSAKRSSASKAILVTVIVLVSVAGFLYWSRRPASIDIDAAEAGHFIPRTFLGFSLEWGSGHAIMGLPNQGTNLIFTQLIKNLFPSGTGPIVVRIGGSSSDALDSNGEPRKSELSAFAQLHKDTAAEFYLSLNLVSSDLGLPARQARYFVENMPSGSLKALEMGNEPDLYSLQGQRPSSYTFDDYLRDYGTRKSGLQSVLPPGMKLIGPSWAMAESLQHLPQFVAAESDQLIGVSQHWYPGVACNGRKNPPDFLLGPGAAASGAREVASSVVFAHQKGLFFRVGEMNSIACNGQPGVTDTFASALWMIDSLFEFANADVDGVNVHMDTDDAYGPFLFNVDATSVPHQFSVNLIRPEYYGLLFFQQAAPGGSKLVRAHVSGPGSLKSWATVDDQNTLRITIINKDKNSHRKVSVNARGYGSGSLVRLLAPNYSVKTGISFGGMSFDHSKDGKAEGSPNSETVVPRDGVYDVQMPPASATLLILRHS